MTLRKASLLTRGALQSEFISPRPCRPVRLHPARERARPAWRENSRKPRWRARAPCRPSRARACCGLRAHSSCPARAHVLAIATALGHVLKRRGVHGHLRQRQTRAKAAGSGRPRACVHDRRRVGLERDANGGPAGLRGLPFEDAKAVLKNTVSRVLRDICASLEGCAASAGSVPSREAPSAPWACLRLFASAAASAWPASAHAWCTIASCNSIYVAAGLGRRPLQPRPSGVLRKLRVIVHT